MTLTRSSRYFEKVVQVVVHSRLWAQTRRSSCLFVLPAASAPQIWLEKKNGLRLQRLHQFIGSETSMLSLMNLLISELRLLSIP